MVEDSSNIGKSAAIPRAAAASSSDSASGASKAAGKDVGQIGKNEFLMMLVAQLKNQDPMDPMKGDQFAVNLAQFSQLEQLISINEKMDKEGSSAAGDLSSISGFLGHEVSMNSEEIQVKNNDGGRVRFYLSDDSTNVKIQLLKADGSVQETIDAGALGSGRHTVPLSALQTDNGNFQVKVIAQTASGTVSPKGFAAGIVTGFVPGADPILLLGDREVRPSEIVEVNVAS